MAARSERDELVRIARELEELAEEGGTDFARRLAEFNARTHATCTRRTFQYLHQAEEPEELVDRLLEIRDASPFVPPRSREELAAYMERAASSGTYVAIEHATRALAHMSKLPDEISDLLSSGFADPSWPSRDEIIDFALAYEPPKTRDEVFALARAWLDDDAAGKHSILAIIGERLLHENQRALAIPELAPIMKLLASGIEVQRKHALARLRKCIRHDGETGTKPMR